MRQPFLLLFLCTLSCSSALADEVPLKERPINALLVTGGCCHDYDRQKLILTRGISARANVRWTVVHQGGKTTNTPIPLYNDPDWAEGFDIVVHNECFSDVKDLEFVDRILKPHKNGTPAILIHCAMHCYRVEDDRWFKFVGLQSPGHGPHYSYSADNLQPKHPIMQDFGSIFVAPKGELYHSVKVFDTATPLAQANRQSDGLPQICVWTNDYEGTRVFGCTMGHYNETMVEPKYLDMMTRGLLWAVGKEPDKHFTPTTEKTNEEIAALVAAPIPNQASMVLPGNCCGDNNVALDKTVTSKSEQDGNFRKHLTDGKLNTRYCPNGAQGDEWVTVDLGETQPIRNIRLHWERRTGTAYRYKVEASENAEDWTTVVDESQNEDTNGIRAHRIDQAKVRYLRTTFLSSSNGGWGSIWELEATAGELADPGDLVSQSDSPAPTTGDVQVPEGFQATLFGTPPEVNYPVCLTAAVNGDVFVGVDEMGSLGKEKGRGKVLRCIDTDGDGVADRINEFTKVDHPRGLIFQEGGPLKGQGTDAENTATGDRLWVLHPPEFSLFTDTTGDGVANQTEILIDGISTEQVDKRGADHTTNGIRMGIDGWIYIAVGDYGFTNAVAPKDGRTLSRRGGGIVRIRPDGTEMEIFSWGQRNIIDVAIDPLMNVFTRDNTNDGGGWDIRLSHILQSANYGYPSLYKHFSTEIMPPLADYGGGSGCGSMFFHDERWPEDYRSLLLTCDWGTSKVYSHNLPANGPTFDAQQDEFLKLPRPTDIDVDGSGRMYVSSWKNGRFGYDGPDVGFVAQVIPENFAPKPVPHLPSIDETKLVALLRSANAAVRLASQQELVRRHAGNTAKRQQQSQFVLEGGLIVTGIDPDQKALVETTILAFDTQAPIHSRVAAIFALKQLTGAFANDALTKLTDDEDVAEFAIKALADRITQLEGVSVGTFLNALTSGNPRIESAGIVAIGRVLSTPDFVASAEERLAAAEALLIKAATFQSEDSGPSADDWRNPHPRRVLAHLAVQTLVKINAVKACCAALNGPYSEGALWALKSMHSSETIDGLFKALSMAQDNKIRNEIWTTLIRLYHEEGNYEGGWWGTRPDTTGPYYDRQKWSESDRIAAAIKVAMAEDDASLNTHLEQQLKRHVVKLEGLSEADKAAAMEPQVAITLPTVDPNNSNQIANMQFDEVMAATLKKDGHASVGQNLFRSQSCISCHTFANGQKPKGPHLVDIGKRYSKKELIESIVDPSRKIAQGFDTWTFVMASGKVHTGFVVLESAETATIRQTDGLSKELLQDDIDERVKQEISMMPKGVVGNLTIHQLADLIAYLQSLH